MRRRRCGGDFTAREKERGAVRGGDLTGSGWVAVYVMGSQGIQTSLANIMVLCNKRMMALCSFKTLRLRLWFFSFFLFSFFFIEGEVGQDFRVNRPKHFVAR